MGGRTKAISPILLCEASIIQLTLNVGQEEVRRDSPPTLWMMLTCQKSDDNDDDGLLSLLTLDSVMADTHIEKHLCVEDTAVNTQLAVETFQQG